MNVAEHSSTHSHFLDLDQVDQLIILLSDYRNRGFQEGKKVWGPK